MQKLYEVWYIAGFMGDINGTSEVVTEHTMFDSGRFDLEDADDVFFSKASIEALSEGETVGPATFVTYTMAVKRLR